MVEGVKALWAIFNGPGNSAIIVGLGVGWVGILIGYVTMYLNFRARLEDKDDRIEDLINVRNQLQAFVLAARGIERKSTDKGKKR